MNQLTATTIPIPHDEYIFIGNIIIDFQLYQNIINSKTFNNLPIETQKFYCQKYFENCILYESCIPIFLERYIKDYHNKNISTFSVDGFDNFLIYN